MDNNASLYLTLGWEYFFSSKRDAVEAFKLAWECDRSIPGIELQIASILITLQQLDEAFAFLTLSWQKEGDRPELFYEFGRRSLMLKDFPEAAKWFEKSLRLDPAESLYHHNLAYALLQEEEDLHRAEFHIREAIRLGPDSADSFSNLGVLCWRTNRPAEAEFWLTWAHRIKPDNQFYIASLLEVYGVTAQYAELYELQRIAFPELEPWLMRGPVGFVM